MSEQHSSVGRRLSSDETRIGGDAAPRRFPFVAPLHHLPMLKISRGGGDLIPTDVLMMKTTNIVSRWVDLNGKSRPSFLVQERTESVCTKKDVISEARSKEVTKFNLELVAALRVKLIRGLAAQGDSFAKYSIGLRYLNGEGVEQSYPEALSWFKKAAEQGFTQAFYQIGMLYAEGKGIPQDFREAVAWTRRAADDGNPEAQFNLGVAYANGQGVKADPVEAYKWFFLSAARGDSQNAADARDRAARGLSRQQLEKARKEILEWVQNHRE